MTPLDFHQALMAYCAAVDGSVSSYGRAPWYNAWKGGVLYSAHLVWLGADVRTWAHLTPEERVQVIARTGRDELSFMTALPDYRRELAFRLGLRLLDEGDHDHLQPLDWRPS